MQSASLKQELPSVRREAPGLDTGEVHDQRFYPTQVRAARLEIVWFESGDVSLHYHEEHESGDFNHRWNRHPSDHSTHDHVHPGPDAPTPGTDMSHPVVEAGRLNAYGLSPGRVADDQSSSPRYASPPRLVIVRT
jgi:hypothetical protein